ncbi:MAG: cation:proton antiporter, partial [Anaerolineae bacterium]|nr:cation:proton antiporter [Anaerolineae bacterium]
MGEDALVNLASIVVLGIGAQWIAWRLQLPSILLLLLAGFIAGPVTGFLDPDHLLGETLFPVVSISVGIILFEGGLTLQRGEIEGVREVVFRLVSVGAVVTWILSTLGAYVIIGLDFDMALLVGAIFIVSGPTVVIPLLNHVRPSGKVGSILKWEGIWIDPVGATIAVLVFEVILAEQLEGNGTATILTGLLRTVMVGAAIGVPAAIFMIQVFKRYWVPEHLQNPVAIMMIVGAFALSNELQAEAGLLTTTLMGVILANQKQISVKHLSQFKEDIGVLLLSGLFIILSARIELESLSNLSARAVAFLALLIVVVRPLGVYLSTIGSTLSWQERVFMAWIAPRGIVAVAVASLFALELHEAGSANYEMLVPLTFLVVVGTVAIYGLTAQRVA